MPFSIGETQSKKLVQEENRGRKAAKQKINLGGGIK